MSRIVDLKLDPDLDRVAQIATELGERIRTDDPGLMFNELVGLCADHPLKAAQLLMVFAVWFDPDVRIGVLHQRTLHVADSQVRHALRRSA